MKGLFTWVFLLFFLALLQIARSLNNAAFKRKQGWYLQNSVIRSVKTKREMDCGSHCLNEANCVSVNYKVKGSDKGLCELNSRTIQDSALYTGESDDDFVYLGVVLRSCKDIEEFSKETKKCTVKAFHSCKDVLSRYGNSDDGTYALTSMHTGGKYQVYCHMTNIETCGGGGWTLVMKLDGTKTTFENTSPLWTNKETYAEQDGLEGLVKKESKLASYWSTPFTNICLGMTYNGVTKWLKLNYTASSLYTVLADGQYKPTTAGRPAWKSLITGSSLQYNCNMEGFNVPSGHASRFGILGNNENDCDSCDSWLGLGGSNGRVCGNVAGCCLYDNGAIDVRTFGYILVQ